MELQELATFAAVAQHGSFSKASRHLGYSQAAVTVQIKHLEEELGVRLFDRLGKKISLTSHGKLFYDHAILILGDIARARDSMKQDDTLTGSLQLGTIDSLCSSVFPALLQEYHRRYPRVSISVTTDTPNILLDMLNNNELDIVYLLDEELNDARWIKVLDAEEKAVFAAASGYFPEGSCPDSLDSILRHPLILTEKDASYRRVLDYMLRLRHYQTAPLFESNNTDLILNMVRSCMGITFLPEYALSPDLEAGSIVKLDIPAFQISIWRQVIHHKDKWVNREMKAFFDLLLELENQS